MLESCLEEQKAKDPEELEAEISTEALWRRDAYYLTIYNNDNYIKI